MELPLEIYISTSMVRTAYQINLLKPESIRGLFGNSAFTLVLHCSFFFPRNFNYNSVGLLFRKHQICLFTKNRDVCNDVTFCQISEVL